MLLNPTACTSISVKSCVNFCSVTLAECYCKHCFILPQIQLHPLILLSILVKIKVTTTANDQNYIAPPPTKDEKFKRKFVCLQTIISDMKANAAEISQTLKRRLRLFSFPSSSPLGYSCKTGTYFLNIYLSFQTNKKHFLKKKKKYILLTLKRRLSLCFLPFLLGCSCKTRIYSKQ